jgi:1-acyl-sn-glycerol-3-phosphate acyltransferase
MLFWIVRSIVWVLLRILYSALGGLRIEGRENVPRKGGVLIAPNHISDADPPTVGFALPRDSYFMAKEELFQTRFIGPLIRALHGFPVKRYTADRSALRFAEKRLEEGNAVVIFPEGKLSEDGKLQEMLPGALLVAHRANVPIVPAILEGTDKLMPYGKLIPQHVGRPIVVRFGAPVTVEELTGGRKGGEALKRGAKRLREILLALQQGRPYPDLSSWPDEEDEDVAEARETSRAVEVAR